MTKVYISHFPYDSSRNETSIIRDRLVAELGEDNVFDSTGSNMHTTTDRQEVVNSCDVLLVVIGRYWSEMVDEKGNRLIEDVYDPVHVEIDAGLKIPRHSMMIHVLVVDGAEIPQKSDLPEALHPLVQRDMFEISDHDRLNDVDSGLVGQI